MRLFIFFLLLNSFGLHAQSTAWNNQLDLALQRQQDHLPQEKLYLQTDRTLYQPGETIWLAAYLTGPDNGMQTARSQLVHVELLAPDGRMLQERKMTKIDGAFAGDFQLSPSEAGGVYKIRAYTNYQGNFGEKYLFEKTVQVQRNIAPRLLMKLETEREAYGPGDTVTAFFSARNLKDQAVGNTAVEYELRAGSDYKKTYSGTTNAYGAFNLIAALPADLQTTDVQISVRLEAAGQKEQISRPVPVTLDNIRLKLLPEGGEWVEGLPCRMAFIAKNEFDEPIDVAGTLYDADDRPVLTFRSLHDGMGSFDLPADVKPPCRVRLQEPISGKRVYPLPGPIAGNWQLSLHYDLLEQLKFVAQAKGEEELQIAIRSNGNLYDCQIWKLEAGTQMLNVDISGLPMGVAQVTVFDQQLRPVWERLVFLHPRRSLQVDFKTDQESYAYRDEVKMDVRVRDSDGKPVQGVFSLAVVDDRLHSFADDKQANILAQLLLSSELSGKIHEPNFYFDPDEEDAIAALDLLMLTHGWRRFHWQELLQQQAADWEQAIRYKAERFRLQGAARMNYRPLASSKLDLDLPTGKITVNTDHRGVFEVDSEHLSAGQLVEFNYQGFRTSSQLNYGLNDPGQALFQPGRVPADKQKQLTFFEDDEQQPLGIAMKEEQRKKLDFDIDQEEAQLLDEVVVTGLSVPAIAKDMAISGVSVEALNIIPTNELNLNMDVDLGDEIPMLRVLSGRSAHINYPRQYAFPHYDQKNVREQSAVDQRKTIYWLPNLRTDKKGKAQVRFFVADEMTTYRTILEGLGDTEGLAYGEHTFSVAPPVSIQVQMPPFVTTGDTLLVPILLQNNTDKLVNVPLTANLKGKGLSWIEAPATTVQLSAGTQQELIGKIVVTGQEGDASLALSAGEGNWKVAENAAVKIYRTGFPREATASGQELRARYDLAIENPIPGTITASLQLFPDLMGELLAGVDAILAEPHGCFEQTSSSNYPNIMVLQYLQKKNELDDKTRQRAWGLLAKGYDKLSSYEVPTGGFSLWGQAPANPVLTAFGLLQFTDLTEVWPKVDPGLIPRTIAWLTKTYEQGNIRSEVDNAYILYALSRCSNYRSPAALARLNNLAHESKTPYLLAVAARLNILYGDPATAQSQIATLLEKFDKDQFGYASQSPTFVHTVGPALSVELMAWTILAALELDPQAYDLKPLLETLLERRYGGGRFGPTQPTVLALQALTAYEQAFARPVEEGMLLVSINQGVADTIAFSPDSRGQLRLEGLGEYLVAGNNSVALRYLNTENPLPYSLQINWQTAELPETKDAPLFLQTRLGEQVVSRSGQVRYHVHLQNRKEQSGYAPMLLLSAPAGLQWQMWQLKAMQDRGQIDYYEVREPYLVIYFETIEAKEAISLDFDLTAIVPGYYQAPSATAYLYYQDDAKSWAPGATVQVEN